MPSGLIRTVDIARASGTHENTVRKYVEWGFLAAPERAPNGYRLWNPDHIDQMVFARLAMHGAWPGRRIRESALSLVRAAATGDLAEALSCARAHAVLVSDEITLAKDAAAFLEGWARGKLSAAADDEWFGPREAAAAIGATPGQVRNWERNRLVNTPKDPETGYRVYGPEELGRLRVVRTLLLAGYSVSAVLRMATELDKGRTDALGDVLNTPRRDEEALTAFDRWLDSLAEQLARAGRLIDMLEGRIARRRL